MNSLVRLGGIALVVALLAAVGWTLAASPGSADSANPCNPCAANPCNPCGGNPCNPCGANPCNPCGANPCNPCGGNPCNPCGGNPCNPCGGNPCGGAATDSSRFLQPAGTQVDTSDPSLLAEGEALWNDKALSGTGALACATCHVGGTSQMNADFAKPYPHKVAMPRQAAGVDQVNAAEMVQFCMLTPMTNDALPWGSRQLAALTAYVEHLQEGFDPTTASAGGANPCNPCGGNPCNPCGGNPCNPCGANPCNPCGG